MKRTARAGVKPRPAGVVVGAEGRTAWLTRPAWGNPHVLLIGATRAGKSRRVILPTVWALGHARESLVLSDPKGELYAMTVAWLRSEGYEVVLLDLLRPTRGSRWNPFAAIVTAHEAGDAEQASKLAWDFGNVLAYGVDVSGGDPIWPQAEESLLAALALATALEAPEGCRHPATAYELLTTLGPADEEGGSPLDDLFRSLPSGHPARRAYGTAALSESRTRASIFTGTSAHLRLFGEPGIAWLTGASEHDPAEAGRKPMAIFLLLPDEGGARNALAALYIAQMYSALGNLAREHGGRLPTPVWFLLDEFGNIPRIPGMDAKLTVAAGRGIRFVLALQDLAQLKKYGDGSQTITGNCDTWLFLRTADVETAKIVSAKLGAFTVQTSSRSARLGSVSSQQTMSESATARPLLTPDEVLRWPTGHSLLIQSGEYPADLPLQDLSAWRSASVAFQPAPPPQPRPTEPVPTWVPGQEAPTLTDSDPESPAPTEPTPAPDPPASAEPAPDPIGDDSEDDEDPTLTLTPPEAEPEPPVEHQETPEPGPVPVQVPEPGRFGRSRGVGRGPREE